MAWQYVILTLLHGVHITVLFRSLVLDQEKSKFVTGSTRKIMRGLLLHEGEGVVWNEVIVRNVIHCYLEISYCVIYCYLVLSNYVCLVCLCDKISSMKLCNLIFISSIIIVSCLILFFINMFRYFSIIYLTKKK